MGSGAFAHCCSIIRVNIMSPFLRTDEYELVNTLLLTRLKIIIKSPIYYVPQIQEAYELARISELVQTVIHADRAE